MYSFFDTYDLIRHMAAGEPKEDSLLVLGNYEEIKKMVPQHNRLIGWGLVGFGVWALYETFISTWLYTLLCSLMGNGYAYDIIRGIPNVVIAALLIFAGLKLLGLHPEKKNRDDERRQYPNLRDYINAEIIPEMQKKLRQGFGRAIRTEQDSCVVAILDERAGIGGRYHDAALAALPSCPTTEKIEDVQQFIREQKRSDYFL